MADTPQQKPAKPESFVGNVMKYSVATYLGFLISGAALIIKGVLPADAYAVPATFMAVSYTHLDVYKRQSSYVAPFLNNGAISRW